MTNLHQTYPQNHIQDHELEHDKRLVSQELYHKLLSIVEAITKQNDTSADLDIQDVFAFPRLAGSHLTLHNPALEFVKSVCAVLALETELEDEVRTLKCDCLHLMGVGEFADETLFRNPCERLCFPQIICSHCTFCRNLDFCRDPDLMPVDGKTQPWQCPGCKKEYDKSLVDERLTKEVQRRLLAYQLQDLVCSQCRDVKMENMSRHCKCGGTYETMESQSEFVRKIQVFANVAREQQLECLKETVEWTLQHC